MATQAFKRKLAAILHADVKGYSRLMGEDEDATVSTLTTYREVMGVLFQKHRGRVVHGTGDSLLAEFISVIDAVQCAVEIQNELETRNAELSEDRKVEFRIGINLGDVIEKDEDLHGDGVNIAARIEGLAEGGGICISRTAFDQVRNKLKLGYEYIGEHSVKNIAQPVRVYRVLMEPEAVGKVIGEKSVEPKRGQRVALAAVIVLLLVVGGLLIWRTASPPVEVASEEKMAFPLPEKPSLAVLPFDNLSGDSSKDYFSDGITETIITTLSNVSNLFVIARNSTFTYKGKPVKVQQVSEELGVRYVLEGSVQRSEDRVRITAQLVDALTGHHLWAENYDRKLGDIFALQDDITEHVTMALQVKLTEGEQARIRRGKTDNPEAYEYFLLGLESGRRFTKEDMAQARKLLEKAVELDPNYAHAWQEIGRMHYRDARFGWTDTPDQSLALAEKLANKTLAINDSDAFAYGTLSLVYMARRQHDEAIAYGEKALALAPNFADVHAAIALPFYYSGRADEAIELVKKAMRLSPFYPGWYLPVLGHAYRLTGQYKEAIDALESWRTRANPRSELPYVMLAFTYIEAGRGEEAHVAVAEILKRKPKASIEGYAKSKFFAYKDPAEIERVLDSLRKAGLPESPPLPLPDKPSIAVLPFENMSDDPKQEYFSDGITDDLITDLSKISGLFVIARNSTFTYKGKPVKVQQVARDLGVRYVLEGSVRKAGEKVRLNAQLIDATTGHHLWAERYDGNLGDIFALQDSFTQKIVAALAVKLTAGEQERSAIKETISIDAYDAFLQGWEHYLRKTPDDFTKALPYFENAIQLDPNYGRAYAALALTYLKASTYGWNSSLGDLYPTSRIRAQQYLENSMKNPTSVAHRVASEMALTRRKHQKAIAEAERAIAIDPNDAESHMIMAKVMLYVGRPEEAITSAKRAMLLDPRNIAFPLGLIGRAHFSMKQFEEVITLTERALKLKPSRTGFASTLAAAYAHLGHNQNARSALDIYTKPWLVPATLQRIMYFYPFKNPEDADLFADGLLKAGLPGKPSGYYKASEEHRLTGEEIKDLLFGHTMTGLWADRKWSISRTKDGKAALLLDSKVIASGKSWIEGDMLCHQWKKRWEGLKFYISIFRNPEGTPKEKNEYILITDWTMYGISIED